MNLAAELQALGLAVVQHDGWQKRGKPGFYPKGVLLHHAGGAYTRPGFPVAPSLGTVTNGRPDLAGPLCHLYVDRSGVVHLIAGRRANHAGACSRTAVQEAAEGRVGARTQSALLRKLPDDAKGLWSGNVRLWGIEVEHCGAAREPWSETVLDAASKAAAALCLASDWSAGHVTLHRNVTKRKVDPFGNTDWWSRINRIIEEYK